MSIRQTRRPSISFVIFATLTTLLSSPAVSQSTSVASPKFSTAVAFDVSPPLRSLPINLRMRAFSSEPEREREIRPEAGPIASDKGYSGDAGLQRFDAAGKTPTIPSPLQTFEGLSNQDNFNLLGGG